MPGSIITSTSADRFFAVITSVSSRNKVDDCDGPRNVIIANSGESHGAPHGRDGLCFCIDLLFFGNLHSRDRRRLAQSNRTAPSVDTVLKKLLFAVVALRCLGLVAFGVLAWQPTIAPAALDMLVPLPGLERVKGNFDPRKETASPREGRTGRGEPRRRDERGAVHRLLRRHGRRHGPARRAARGIEKYTEEGRERHLSRISLPRKGRRVGLHIVLFEARSAFTRVAACTLARPPIRGPLYRRLQPLGHLHDCSGCFRLERLPGGPCTH